MGADLLIHTLMWDKKRKLDFKAGHRVIDEMDDDDSLNAECVCKEDLHAALKDVEDSLDGSRDAFTFDLLHLNVFITGGMSWGDSPTETYNSVQNLVSFPQVLDAVGINLDEDLFDYKALVMRILKNRELLPMLLGKDKHLDTLIEGRLKKNVVRNKPRPMVH